MLVLSSATAWFYWRFNQVDRVKFDTPLAEADRGAPENFLIVGSDDRTVLTDPREAEAYGTADATGPAKADTILVARTFPAQNRVAIVSFPRDLLVPIAGTNTSDRINSAIEGGAGRLVDTIRQAYGIEINHFVQIDFRGFKGLVNAVGGVDVPFSSPVRDWDPATATSPTGLRIDQAGCRELNGDEALAYVRSRHYERFVDGEWQPDPTGDLNRINRQQDFLRRVLRKALSRRLLDPRRLNGVLNTAIDYVSLDDTLAPRDLLRFGRQFRAATAESLDTYSLPTRPETTPAGAQVLVLDDTAATPVLDVFRGVVDRPSVVLPGSVRLRVVDVAGRSGRLRAAAFRLAAAGFVVASVENVPDAPARTTLRHGPGARAAAELVQTHLVAKAELVEDAGVGGDLVLALGGDWQGVTETSKAPAPTTTSSTPQPTEPDATTTAPPTTAAPPPTSSTTPPAVPDLADC